MRVLVLVKAGGGAPTPEAMAAMHAFGDAMVAAGVVIVDGAGLLNTQAATRIAFDDGRITATPGPFAETSALVAGYSIWDVRDMDEALAWARRWPAPPGQSEIELRPLFLWQPDAEGFAEKTV